MTRSPQFDPALKELLLRRTGHPLAETVPQGAAGERVAVIARLADPAVPVPGLDIVARFGHVVTGRVALGSILAVRAHPNVASLKASQSYAPTLHRSVPEIGARGPDGALPQGVGGRGVVVGVVDWGCDFVHSNFRDDAGRTRILRIWDQRGGSTPSSPAPFGYGRELTRREIDAALAQPDPYAALGYDPADADPGGSGTHGTHVLDIAAGNGRAAGTVPGVAPLAELVFVHLRGDDTGPQDTLGDSARVLEAVRYIVDSAGGRPVVVNLSLGRTGGPHDASPLVVQGLDALLREAPGRALVMSAGNYLSAGLHTAARIAPGGYHDVRWQVRPRAAGSAEMEVWYPAADLLAAELWDPAGRLVARAGPGEDQVVRDGTGVVASLYHRRADPNNGDNHVNLFLWPAAADGTWTVRLLARRVADGRFHAWIERDDPATQSHFPPDQAVPSHTTGTICNGRRTVAVGAYDARVPTVPAAPFSSAGPTRDGRAKPDVSAPGAGIRAARSSYPAAAGRRVDGVAVKSGTSMAAPHVAGVVALMFEAAGRRRLTADETLAILRGTARRTSPGRPEDRLRYGAGRVDAAAAVGAARRLAAEAARPAPLTQLPRGVRMHSENLLVPAGAWAGEADDGEDRCTECGTARRRAGVWLPPDSELFEGAEAGPVAAGRAEVAVVPMLAAHHGTGPDLVLRWNDMPGAPAEVDVVLHLHGYSAERRRMDLRRHKEPVSGLDFRDPAAPAPAPGTRSRPTVGVLPRGRHFGGATGDGFDFPALMPPGAVRQLVTIALERFAAAAGVETPRMARLIVSAHSGGGAALVGILRRVDPHEVHVFDALYGAAPDLSAWVRTRIRRDVAVLQSATPTEAARHMAGDGGALRIAFRPREGTGAHTRAVAATVARELPAGPLAGIDLRDFYRVQGTTEPHGTMPRHFGWRFLADPGTAANPPAAAGAPAPPRPAGAGTLGEQVPSTPRPRIAGLTEAEEKALRITNAFENTTSFARNGGELGFGGLTGNFDGMGLSFGLLQWNIGSGSLQPLLAELARDRPERFDVLFGPEAARMRQVLALPLAEQMAWARSVNDARNRVVEPWATRFAGLADDPDFRRIQLGRVRQRLRTAAGYARDFGLASERGLALMFDTVTQQGPAWLDQRDRAALIRERRAAWERGAGRPPTERELLEIIANVSADTANPRWRADVRRRRMTVVTGTGTVHGHAFDLARDFGLGDGPWQVPAVPTAEVDVPVPGTYLPAGGRTYLPAVTAFRCAPTPPTVGAATLLPVAAATAADADTATRTVLRQLGVSAARLTRVEASGGIAALRAVARRFGAAALAELVARLRYSAEQLAAPPHDHQTDAAVRALGVPGRAALLAPRVLLAVPGHFRELARRAPTAAEAHALECTGWLLMRTLRDEIATETGVRWWVPPAPAFVTALPVPLPTLSAEAAGAVRDAGASDAGVAAEVYRERLRLWENGLAGRHWRLETGLEVAPEGAGRPFYSRVLTLPAAVNTAPDRARVQRVWADRVAAVVGSTPDLAAQTAQLISDASGLLPAGLMIPAMLQGLVMLSRFPGRMLPADPSRLDGTVFTRLRVLGVTQPVWEQIFRTIAELGWNDLLFQSAGAAVFRGRKSARGTPVPEKNRRARLMSEHGLGIAADFNTFENPQRQAAGAASMDPRIVALFEAFSFRWGQCFGDPDPMHFEYCGGSC